MTIQISYSTQKMAEIIKAGIYGNTELLTASIEYLSLDSRKVLYPETTIFFALATPNKNAADFIPGLYKKGVRVFVTNLEIDLHILPEAVFLKVSDPLYALQQLAIYHRNEYHFPIIGITGSNGKTVIKEWIYHLLHSRFSIVRSPKSFNSQIGVPLSILHINGQHNLGVFEAGISMPDEMKRLQQMIQPTFGMLTNIGNAHDEGFIDRKQKLKEKLALFTHVNTLIFCSDYEWIDKEVAIFLEKYPHIKCFKWGRKSDNELCVVNLKKEDFFSKISIRYNDEVKEMVIPFTDDASIENALHCWCACLCLNVADNRLLEAFADLPTVAMRLELKPGINHCTIINDSYSNDLQSLNIALDFLQQQNQRIGKTVILSDILQSGLPSAQLYNSVATLLTGHQVGSFIGIGSAIFQNRDCFSNIKTVMFFESTQDFLSKMPLHLFHDETILIKGARQFEFEKITHFLEQKVHQTELRIHLNHLVHNLKKYREQLHPQTKMMAMVKAFGYGSGSGEIASVLEYNGVDYLATAYTDEAVELRRAGCSLPIMIMNIEENAFEAIINFNLEPELFSFSILNSFLSFLTSNNLKHYPVHIKLDTGMHRLGFEPKDLDLLISILKDNPLVKIKSCFSHLAASDNVLEEAFTHHQFESFNLMSSRLEKELGYSFLRHIANTSAISRKPELQLDMVRLGIGLYGVDSNPIMQQKLLPVSTLRTTISQIKNIKKGETVGYNRMGVAHEETKIATVRLGYADGYKRNLSNGKGKMLVGNQLAPVIGNVCMDMTMLDISGIENVEEGDEVIVFGEGLPVQDVAQWAQTIPYEILTGISQRVKRIYFEES